MDKKKKALKGIIASIAVICIAVVVNVITTLALARLSVSVKSNTFRSGNVSAAIVPTTKPGSDKIVDASYYEPGQTLKGTFKVVNTSEKDEAGIGTSVYYRVYLENTTESSLADYILVTLLDGDQELLKLKATEFTPERSLWLGPLAVDESKELTILFKMDENAGNDVQGEVYEFDIKVDSTQARNQNSESIAY